MPFLLAVLGVIVLIAVIRFYTAKNYLDRNEPLYAGNFAIGTPESGNELTVVSYNISYGKNIDQALLELKDFLSKKKMDILLLQEMEERGTDRMARELHLNYVYFPATIEPKYGRNFGNAVLSPWPIVDAQKLILPHISLSDRMKRIATRATIRIRDTEIIAYSIHTEPVFIWPKFKEEQCFAILDDTCTESTHVIVGGDFNSFTETYVKKIEMRYEQAGFIRASKGIEYTFARFGMRMYTDQIFTKGFVVETTGRIANAKASDHLPIWVTLMPK